MPSTSMTTLPSGYQKRGSRTPSTDVTLPCPTRSEDGKRLRLGRGEGRALPTGSFYEAAPSSDDGLSETDNFWGHLLFFPLKKSV